MVKLRKWVGICLVVALALVAVLWQASSVLAEGRQGDRSRSGYVQQGGYDDEVTDEVTDDDNDGNGSNGRSDNDANEVEVQGVLKARPAEPELQGTWVVSTATGDVTFTVEAGAQLELEDGPLSVGSCVEIEASSATPNIATGIESESANECGAAGAAGSN